MSAKATRDEQGYGIGAVAKLTGLTDHTIRVWERRYGAVVAERAANGRRIYSSADVEKLGLLKSLTNRGIAISQVASVGIEELRAQARSLNAMSTAAVPERIRVAVLGDLLPGKFANGGDTAPIDIVIADSNRERFQADLGRQNVDVVVLESAVLNTDTLAQLRDLLAQSGTERAVVVYSFGRSRDVELVRDSTVVVLRAPVSVDEICAGVIRTYSQPGAETTQDAAGADEKKDTDWQFAGRIAPRRFDQQQLARLANTATAIECECPQHLAQLVSDLSAFEIYSAGCANRSDEDAALHQYLHQATAEARALIEVALERVADAEGLLY